MNIDPICIKLKKYQLTFHNKNVENKCHLLNTNDKQTFQI